jgi:hypothetical protein
MMAGTCRVNAQSTKRLLTVREAIQTTRIIAHLDGEPVLVSPDRKRYLVVLYRGDIERNGSWIELLCGRTTSLSVASAPVTIARLFSKSTVDVDHLISNIHWLDDSNSVTFLWKDGRQPAYIASVNVGTRRMQTRIRHSTAIVKYDISKDGKSIVFIGPSIRNKQALSAIRRRGFAVTGQSISSLLQGNLDGWDPRQHYDVLVTPSAGLARQVRIPRRTWAVPPELLKSSPDGHYAIVVLPAGQPPPHWDKYTEHVFKDIYLRQALQHPDSPNWIRQYFLIDLRRGSAQPLWDAPSSPFGRVLWSPDSRHLVIGPTFIPVPLADAAGLTGRAVVEMEVRTGHFVQLPLASAPSEFGYEPRRWSEGNVVELTEADKEDGIKLRFKKTDGVWRPSERKNEEPAPMPPVRVEIRQDLNTPPALYAVETATGHERLIRDLNPQLRDFVLARVEIVHWSATDGRPWTGLLYYPSGYRPERMFPLVVQTHGYLRSEFSLDGAFTTVFSAQPLASRGIAVLQVGGPDDGDVAELGTSREVGTYIAGFEGAIKHFAALGLADRNKVGIIGFSRSGWVVLSMLTNPEIPLAAAEVADNMDGGYFQYVLGDSDVRTFNEVEKGAPPFGKGLEVWSRKAPGFNADKIRTPLRMEIDSGPISRILAQWEMFSNLRHLGKPVELFVIPDIEHGTHVLQNPAQRLASQGGTVDWFAFWLKDEEDTDPAKVDQYIRWRDLRRLQDIVHGTR